jgi:hypothetical protein
MKTSTVDHQIIEYMYRYNSITLLTWMRMALREDETSTSLAPVMYRSRRSAFSSALVASRSNRAYEFSQKGRGKGRERGRNEKSERERGE